MFSVGQAVTAILLVLLIATEAEVTHWQNQIAALETITPKMSRNVVQVDRSLDSGQPKQPADYTSWLTLAVLAFQAYIFWRQSELMKGAKETADQQARTMLEQRNLMSGQLETAKTAAQAAEKAANAALAALDRPWLAIEGLKHNELEWVHGKEELISEFRITNYGKAPAFLMIMKTVFFKSPGPFLEADFPVKPLPDGILHFPSASELGNFLYQSGRPPLADIGEGLGERRLSRDKFGVEVAIASGGSTETFYCTGRPRLVASTEGIPLEAVTNSYLIGQVFYSVPGQETEIITFCYQGNRHGTFDLLFGAPYNDRQKVPHSGNVNGSATVISG